MDAPHKCIHFLCMMFSEHYIQDCLNRFEQDNKQIRRLLLIAASLFICEGMTSCYDKKKKPL